MNKKAYGFPTTELLNFGHTSFISGVCVDEQANVLGGWTSTNIDFLKQDLSSHAKGYEYSFSSEIPAFIRDQLERKKTEKE